MYYTLIRSSRRTLSLEISREGEITVRAPRRCPQSDIDRFLASHGAWIAEHSERQRRRREAYPEPDEQESLALMERARLYLPERTEYFAGIMGLRPLAVRITGARKRFGSCSGENRICYSWRLMQYPPEAVDYVVVHELAHIVHKNHGGEFYALVASVLPDWKERRARLK